MPDKASALEVAARIAEKRFSETQTRYDGLNQKLSSYLAILAIAASILALFVQNLFKADNTLILFVSRMKYACVAQLVLFAGLVLSTLGTVACAISALVRIIQALAPITLQVVDQESIDEALSGRRDSAIEMYVRDMIKATTHNRDAIRDRFSLIFSINRWLVAFIVAYVILVSLFLLFMILF